MNDLYLICCIGVSQREFFTFAMLRHFCEHYIGQGIRPLNFRITLHTLAQTDNVPQVTSFLGLFGITPVKVMITPEWDCFEFYAANEEAAANLPAQSWLIVVDFDEFIYFPKALPEFISEMEAEGIDLVVGQLVDRVSSNYELNEVALGEPLWDQFPVAAEITSAIPGACIKKTCLLRNYLGFTFGHHFTKRKCKRAYPRKLSVFHFKWESNLLPRLDKRKLQFERNRKRFWWHRELDDLMGNIDGRRVLVGMKARWIKRVAAIFLRKIERFWNRYV